MQNPNVALITTNDIDQLPESVDPWEMRFTQLTSGKFSSRCKVVKLESLVIYRECWTHRVLANGASPPGYFVLGYAPNVTWCGKTIEPGRLAFGAPGAEVNLVTVDGSDHLVVLVPKGKIEHLLEGEAAVALPTNQRLIIDKRLQQEFTSFVRKVVSQPERLNSPYAASALESRLLQLFEDSVATPTAYKNSPSDPAQWSTVLRTLECLDESNYVSSIPKLARAVSVSQRTLEHAFRNTLGITPLKFDRFRRLMGTHKALCEAEPDSPTTVADIAGQWGFNELGRFAVQYRGMFQEKPSQTLRKCRAAPRSRLADMLLRRPTQAPATFALRKK